MITTTLPSRGLSRLRLLTAGVIGSAAIALVTASGASAAALPPAGNPDGVSPIPAEAQAEDTSNPDYIIGNGTPESCTSAEVVAAVALGGVITFDCGPDPVTIPMFQTAKVVNDAADEIVMTAAASSPSTDATPIASST